MFTSVENNFALKKSIIAYVVQQRAKSTVNNNNKNLMTRPDSKAFRTTKGTHSVRLNRVGYFHTTEP